MTTRIDSNLSEEHALPVFLHPHDAAQDLTLEDARIALDAVQRMNAKLETENVELRQRVELLDQLVVKLLKQNDNSPASPEKRKSASPKRSGCGSKAFQ